MSSISQHALAKRFETQPLVVLDDYIPPRLSSLSQTDLSTSPYSPLRLEQKIQVLSHEGHEGHFKKLIDLSERIHSFMQQVTAFSTDLIKRNGYNKLEQCSTLGKYVRLFNTCVTDLQDASLSRDILQADYLGQESAVYQLHALTCPRIQEALAGLSNLQLLAEKASKCWEQAQGDLLEVRMLLLWGRIFLNVTLDTQLKMPSPYPSSISSNLLLKKEIERFSERLRTLDSLMSSYLNSMEKIHSSQTDSMRSLITDLWSSFVVAEASRIDQKIHLEVYNQRMRTKEIKDFFLTSEEVVLVSQLPLGSVVNHVVENDKNQQNLLSSIEDDLSSLLSLWQDVLSASKDTYSFVESAIEKLSPAPSYLSGWIPSYFTSSSALPTTPSIDWIANEMATPGCLPFQLGAYIPQVQPVNNASVVTPLNPEQMVRPLEKQVVEEIIRPVQTKIDELFALCKNATQRIQNFQEAFSNKGRIWSQEMLDTALLIKKDYTVISQLAPDLVSLIQETYESLDKALHSYLKSLPEEGRCFYDRSQGAEGQQMIRQAKRHIAEHWTFLRLHIDNLLVHRYWLDTDHVYADTVALDWRGIAIRQQKNPPPEFVSCDHVSPNIWIEEQVKLLSSFSQRVDGVLAEASLERLPHHRDFVVEVLQKFLFDGLQNYINQRLDAMECRIEVLKKRQLNDKLLAKICESNPQHVYKAVLQVVKRASEELFEISAQRARMLGQYRHAALTLEAIITKMNNTRCVGKIAFAISERLRWPQT